ncbi:MAG: penicillin-binding transpeptidase domain-containing protein, partial [Mariprofundaceae bacterium]
NITPLPETKFVNAYANSVFQQLKAHFGAQTLRRQGLTIIVPYNAFDQNAAIHSLRKGVLEIEQRQFYRGPENHFEPEQWDKILSQWARSRPDNPRLEEELFPALIRKISRNGQMIVNDGIEKWHLPKPKWQWDKAIPRSSRVWKVGDQIWLQGNGKTGVRLTQKPSIEAALYAIDLKHGTVAAEVGGFDYRMGDFDRVTQARRQPGSAFKPFLYAAAMDKDFTPATVLMDTPVAFENQALDNFWRPDNYRNSFAGPVTLRDALEHSRNLASIKLLQDVGISSFLRSLGSYQFKHKFPPQLALALGATEVTLGDLTESYAVIADGGKRWQPVWIQQVQDRDGRTLHRSVAGNRCQICHVDPVLGVGTGMQPAEQTLDPVSSFLATNMMRGVIDRGTGVRAKQLGRPAAGKTGTTNNQVDAWFVGFTPQIITGVWAGRDKPTSMGRRETGSRAALPIWLGTMTAMHKGKRIEDFTPPEGIEWRMIDRKTGKPADKSTIKPFMEAFRSGSGPTKEESGKLNTAPTAGEKSEDFFDLDL